MVENVSVQGSDNRILLCEMFSTYPGWINKGCTYLQVHSGQNQIIPLNELQKKKKKTFWISELQTKDCVSVCVFVIM